MTIDLNKSPPENDSPITTLRYMLDRYHSERSLKKIELFAWLNHDAPALIAEHEQLLTALYHAQAEMLAFSMPVPPSVTAAIAKARGQQ